MGQSLIKGDHIFCPSYTPDFSYPKYLKKQVHRSPQGMKNEGGDAKRNKRTSLLSPQNKETGNGSSAHLDQFFFKKYKR